MKAITAETMRELDRKTIEEFGTPGDVLMERAGQGVADAISDLAEAHQLNQPATCLIAGKGNNGGDAFVAARYLLDAGMDVETWLIAEPDDLRGDARIHFDKMCVANVPLRELSEEDLHAVSPDKIRDAVIVDGLLGTGISGEVRGDFVTDGNVRYIICDPTYINADIGMAMPRFKNVNPEIIVIKSSTREG